MIYLKDWNISTDWLKALLGETHSLEDRVWVRIPSARGPVEEKAECFKASSYLPLQLEAISQDDSDLRMKHQFTETIFIDNSFAGLGDNYLPLDEILALLYPAAISFLLKILRMLSFEEHQCELIGNKIRISDQGSKQKENIFCNSQDMTSGTSHRFGNSNASFHKRSLNSDASFAKVLSRGFTLVGLLDQQRLKAAHLAAKMSNLDFCLFRIKRTHSGLPNRFEFNVNNDICIFASRFSDKLLGWIQRIY